MANGTIKTPVPNMVTSEQLMANSIASAVVPQAQGDIFSQLAEGRPDIRTTMPYEASLNNNISEPRGTTTLKALQGQLVSETRPELARRTGLTLPNLAKGPTQGIATAGSKRFLSQQQYEQAVDGGQGASAAAGDTRYVDDKGWPVSLKQLLGSRLLSPEMLKKASIGNVQKLIQVAGGTEQQRQEMQFMFQRMMLEGFVRGVDITKELSRQGGIKYTIGDYATIGVHSNGKIIFDKDWWNKKSDADKYTLFLHETGHSLLDAHHENDRSQKKKDPNRIMTPIYAGSVLRNYDKLMDQFFSESKDINKFKVQDFGQSAAYDANGYPALTGVQTGPPGTAPPAGTGEAGDDPTKGGGSSYNATTTNQYTINPAEINMAEASEGAAGVSINKMGPTQSATIMGPGGQLSGDIQTATKTFAAGMADLSKQGPDMAQAGALLKSG